MGAIVASSAKSGGGTLAAFLNGFHHALVTAAALTLLGAAVAALTLGGRPQREPERAPTLVEA
jgi:hypothetical protein